MASRVERYYDKNVDVNKRSVKNIDLYRTIYEDETYSNIEGIVETPKTNEIDISKIKDLLIKQEKEYKTRNQLVKKELDLPDMDDFENLESKNYDIRDILAQAKNDKEISEDDRLRSLKYIDFDSIREKLNHKEKYKPEEIEKDLTDLQELISTVTGTNKDLNNLADKELSLDMFSDLAASTSELSREETNAIQKVIADAKRIEERNNRQEVDMEVDKSFYTTTLNLKKKDFEIEDEEEVKPNTGKRVVLILVFIIIAIIAVVIGYNFIK
jgi:hypothetical protein